MKCDASYAPTLSSSRLLQLVAPACYTNEKVCYTRAACSCQHTVFRISDEPHASSCEIHDSKDPGSKSPYSIICRSSFEHILQPFLTRSCSAVRRAHSPNFSVPRSSLRLDASDLIDSESSARHSSGPFVGLEVQKSSSILAPYWLRALHYRTRFC
jgi:hypothetical protein